jgi:hypothetical protein
VQVKILFKQAVYKPAMPRKLHTTAEARDLNILERNWGLNMFTKIELQRVLLRREGILKVHMRVAGKQNAHPTDDITS